MATRFIHAWTDYLIVALGDMPGKDAPIRECFVLAYDGNKYLTIEVAGRRETVKSGYVYTKRGRRTIDKHRCLVFSLYDGGVITTAPCLTAAQLMTLPRCE